MTTLAVSTILKSIIDLLTEAYAGPPNPNETWFIDNQPDSGILIVLSGISAAEASTGVGHGEAETIAANAEHLRWSLANANAALRGEPYNPRWHESWQTSRVSAAEWDRLRQALRGEYESLRGALKQQTDLPGAYLNGTLALVAHAAYHLGVIRQLVARVRAAP